MSPLSCLRFLPALAVLAGCGHQSSTAANNAAGTAPLPAQINFYDFTGEIGAHTLSGFEQRTGIRVRFVDIPDNATLQTRLLTGHSEFDVVVPTSNVFGPLINAGTLQKLDRKKLPHWPNLDPEMLKRLESADPGNQYGVPYVWGSMGLAYDETKVRSVLGREPEKSLRLIFEPEFARKLTTCGVGWNDGAGFILTDMALIWLGRDPSRPRIEDLPAVEAALMRARPFVRQIDSMSFDSSLANGDLCMTTGPNGDLLRAADLGNATRTGADLR
ncbi:MAG: extracellular solute-binding protein, partial [Steroidobacteraceae bacterium]